MFLEILGVAGAVVVGKLLYDSLKGDKKKPSAQTASGVDEEAKMQEELRRVKPKKPIVFESMFGKATYYINPRKGICKRIIARDGRIINFPGFENHQLVLSHLEDVSESAYVRFGSYFERKPQGNFIFIWDIQPDGMYWSDGDGYGAEKGQEVRLYTYLDDEGHFTAPFKIYSIGVEDYFGTDREEKEALKLAQSAGSNAC
ncbi:MAG: hypothetical protein IJG23_07395 [Clostridia bacterium]|nr:hypothetical protein [Clostridia bacterium]